MRLLLPALLVAAWLPAGVAALPPPDQERVTDRARSQGGAPRRHVTPHLDVVTSLSDRRVAPGQRFRITLDITPKPGVHVYAPGEHGYRVIALRLEPNAVLRTYPVKYPKSVEYVFEPLNERVQVYEQRFRLVHELEVTASAASRQPAQPTAPALTVRGVLAYQACTNTICYPPEELPLEWVVALEPQARGVK